MQENMKNSFITLGYEIWLSNKLWILCKFIGSICFKVKRGFNSEGSKITPVVCFPTTINPIIQNGFQPGFVDVTLPDLNPDLDQVEMLLENDPDIRGIVFAHVLGNPPDMNRLMELVDKHDLVFVEDACDALGSR